MKLVFASDSFKGSLSSKEIAALLKKASNEVFEECDTLPLILADGGEGTLEAVLSVMQGRKVSETVHGPLMQKINACYGSFAGKKAMSSSELLERIRIPYPEQVQPEEWGRR